MTAKKKMQSPLERFEERKQIINELVRRREYDAALTEINGIYLDIKDFMIGYAFAGKSYADFMSQSGKMLEQLSNARKIVISYISSNQHTREVK